MPDNKEEKKHIFLGRNGRAEKYTYPKTPVIKTVVPSRNRRAQAAKLLSELGDAKRKKKTIEREAEEYDLESSLGIQVTFDSFPGVNLAFESLADSRQKIELLNVKHHDDQVTATVLVPSNKLDFFEKKIKDYLEERKNKKGGPLDNRKLIDAINSIRESAFAELWNDDNDVLPSSDDQSIWWEIWLPVLDDRTAIIHDFRKIAAAMEIVVSESALEFPERTVLQAWCSRAELSKSALLLSKISEIRRAKETAEFFDSLAKDEQGNWAEELLSRTSWEFEKNSPYVCILDSGINPAHPLLEPFLDPGDRHTVNADWDVSDENGHGSGMGGLSIWGDLTERLSGSDLFKISHRLESVKILINPGDNKGKHHGVITADGVSLPEISAYDRTRVFTLAVSATDSRDRGRPSAWSSTIDSLCSDYLGDNRFPRLMLVCAGNTGDSLTDLMDYPDHNTVQDVHDPGQSWNALTIGGYTRKDRIEDVGADDYTPLAPSGGLSPYSTTSAIWESSTPIKPEVVFEAGNVGKDKYSCAGLHSLKLLTTHHDPSVRFFSTFEATSAATALAARFAAQIYSEYPDLRPETVRGLTVHSANWTPEMYDQFADKRKTRRQNAQHLVRCVGFGVPDLERAIASLRNSVVMIAEDELQPFEKKKGKTSTKDMHLHELPWPRELLASLGEVEVKMTVTLSYYVEPNPSSRNVSTKYRYPSHQLRFDVKRPTESLDEFRARTTREAKRVEEGSTPAGTVGDPNWTLGEFRHKGSIHKDIWQGTAADLAERGYLVVYPAMGWWRTRTKLDSTDKKARYSLIVSIESPSVDVDLYTEIQNSIVSIPNEVLTTT